MQKKAIFDKRSLSNLSRQDMKLFLFDRKLNLENFLGLSDTQKFSKIDHIIYF